MPLRRFLDLSWKARDWRCFFDTKGKSRDETMPNHKAIHETPREILGIAPRARSQAVSLHARRRGRDWFAYKGRPAARPAPPLKAPAPPPKQTPAPAPGEPRPSTPAKEPDAGTGHKNSNL